MNKKVIVIISAIAVGLLILAALSIRKSKLSFPPAPGDSVSASGLLSQAKALEKKSDPMAAKALYQKLVAEFSGSSEVMNWQKKIEELNIKLLFSAVITPKSQAYEIKPGDTLAKIAKKFNTTPELIRSSNNISADRIFPGRKIKVWNAPFNILVDKSQNILILKSSEDVIKTYIVSTGKDNCTPVGNFKITNKLTNPTWFKAGAVVPAGSVENVLGTRWMGFDLAGYGIHGTTEPQHLGQQVTQGCVRLSNPDVEELYTIVPVGTEVTVVD